MPRRFIVFVQIILLISLLTPTGSQAMPYQANPSTSYSISGKVTDEKGQPLAGVTISASGGIQIVNVSAEHDLAGYYPIGLGEVENTIRVEIDWGLKTPGKVVYQFNQDAPVEDAAADTRTAHTFRFDQVLQPGANTLTITAEAADHTVSAPHIFRLTGWTAELGWLKQVMGSLPYIGPNQVELKVYIPAKQIEMAGLDIWLPGRLTNLSPQAVGILTIPLSGGRYSGGLGRHFEAEFDRYHKVLALGQWQGRQALKLLGVNSLETDFLGQVEGNLTDTPPYLNLPDLVKFSASGKTSFEVSASALNVLYPLAPVGPAVVKGLRALPPVYNWVKNQARFYVQLTPELGGDMTLNWGSQDMQPVSSKMYVQIELEGGLKFDLSVAEGKVYLNGGSKLDFTFVPQSGFDQWVFYGKMGYELKAGWFKTAYEDSIEWTAYERGSPQGQSLLAKALAQPAEWTLIPRTYVSPSYARFTPAQQITAPFATPGLAPAQGTLTATLVSSVFPYAEPALAVRSDDQALLLWNYDNPNRPLGQGYDLQFSRWDGSAWSAPAAVTNDTYPDANPQVVWMSNGVNAMAVWERLDDPALPVDASLTITQTRKIHLAFAVYNADINTWSPPQWVSYTGGHSDQTPILSRDAAGSLWLAWRNNPNGNLSGNQEFPDRIMTARFYYFGWEPVVAVSPIPGIGELAFAHNMVNGTLAWTVEMTPTGSLTPTMQLFSAQYLGPNWGPPHQLTADSVQNTHPRLVYNQGLPYVAWLAGGALVLQPVSALQNSPNRQASLLQGQAVNLPGGLQIDQFNLLQDPSANLFAVFTAQEKQQRDLYLAYYDAALDLWGQPQSITHDAASESYPAAALDSQQRLLIGFSRTDVLTQALTTTLPGTTQVISYTQMVEGSANLVTFSHSLRSDLAVESLSISPELPNPGGRVMVTATLANRGDRPLQNFGFVFQNDGAPFASRAIAGPLAGGDVLTVTASYTPVLDGAYHTLTAIADPENLIAEIDKTNNQRSLQVFGPDLAIREVFLNQQGRQADVSVVVQNLGVTGSHPGSVDISTFGSNSASLQNSLLPPLAPGQTITLSMPVDVALLSPGQHTLVVHASQMIYSEVITANNLISFTLLSGADLALDANTLRSTPLNSVKVSVGAEVQNTGSISSSQATLAVYSQGSLDPAQLIYTATLPALAAGSTYTFSANLDGPFPCGLYLQIDPARALVETSRANNLAMLPNPGGLCRMGKQLLFLPLVGSTSKQASNAPSASRPVNTAAAANPGNGVYTAITAADGSYTLADLPTGEYRVTAQMPGMTFKPASSAVTLPPAAININFVRSDMVNIPAGSFAMGCDPAHNDGYACIFNEIPLHTVYLDEFQIDLTEVTNAQYAACVAAGGCTQPASAGSSTRSFYYVSPLYASYPVLHVDWSQAGAYCAWAGKRLPTEAEWEKAARGPAVQAYAWGDASPSCALTNGFVGEGRNPYCAGDTTAVGSHPAGASPYGVLDMTGNVWEWVSDWYDESYYNLYPPNGWPANPTGPLDGTLGLVRGGSWTNSGLSLRSAFRDNYPREVPGNDIGIRCVKAP